MTDYCYSLDEENFSYNDLDEAIQFHWDDNGQSDFVVYRGIKSRRAISHYLNVDVDNAINAAWDEHSEYADGFLSSSTQEQENELKAEVSKVVEAWATKHGHTVDFWDVYNVKPLHIRIVGSLDHDGHYEVVSKGDGDLL